MAKTSFPLPKTGEEFLNQVKSQHKEIKALEDEKKEYWVSVSAIGSPDYEHERVDGGQPKGTVDKLIKLEEYGLLIDQQYDKLMSMKILATDMINDIPDSEQRAVLREYYILDSTYRDIARQKFMSKSKAGMLLHAAVLSFNRIYRKNGTKWTHKDIKT